MGSCIGISGITINLDQNNLVYFTDEPLTGIVHWNNTSAKIQTKEVYLKLVGEIGYTTQQTVSDDKGGSTTQTRYHRVPFYSSKISLARPAAQEEMIVFQQGEYSWPFQLTLANHLPPSFNSPQRYPHVSYSLQVVIEKSWYKPNTKQLKYLTIYPRIDLSSNPQWFQPTFFGKQNRKDLSLKGTINKIGLVFGDSIELTIDIENPKEVLIKHIDLSIIQFYTIGANSGRQNIFQTTLSNILNTNRRQINEILSMITPALFLPPSYEFRGGLERSVSVHIHYLLRFAVKVGGIFTNFDIDLPIIIANERRSHLNQQSLPVQQYEELPPSYESVMQNDK